MKHASEKEANINILLIEKLINLCLVHANGVRRKTIIPLNLGKHNIC